MPKDLSIIIVNYNSEDCIAGCIDSIRKFVQGISYEIIVVDNDSPGKDKLKELNGAAIIYSEINKGFGYGCNKGAENSTGELLLFLNPDTEFRDDSLPRLVKFYRDNAVNGYGAVSPVFTDREGNMIYSYNDFPNFRWELAEALGLDGTSKITRRHLAALESYRESGKEMIVDAFTGACILISSALFRELGGFDEKMFLYFEDTDLQKRIFDKGLKNVIDTSCSVLHMPNTSTKSVNGEIFYYSNLYRSRVIYYGKHLFFLKSVFFRLMHSAGISARLLSLPFRSKYGGMRKEYAGHYLNLLSMLLFNRLG